MTPTPGTAAGRALLDFLAPLLNGVAFEMALTRILAIEAQAAPPDALREALERLATASEMARRYLVGTTPCFCGRSPHEGFCGNALHAIGIARAALAAPAAAIDAWGWCDAKQAHTHEHPPTGHKGPHPHKLAPMPAAYEAERQGEQPNPLVSYTDPAGGPDWEPRRDEA